MQKQLKDFTEVELKAINWDTLVQVEKLQAQMKAINDELNSRTQNAQGINNMENEVTGTEVVEETAEVTGTETPE